MDFAHTCACASGVRPALTCEDKAITQKEQRNKKRALKDKSKKPAAKKPAAKKPMSKAQGKKKAAVNKKASKSAFLWYDSSEEEGARREEEMPVARPVGVEDSSESDSSPPWDEHVPGPDATSNDESD